LLEKIKKMLKLQDRLLLRELQNNFPFSGRPYLEIGKRLRLSEEEVIERIKVLKKKKIIRYIGAIFDTKKLGLASSLIAMSVPCARIKKVSNIINSYPQVSHNYLRNNKFNLWFTLSAASKRELLKLIHRIKKRTRIGEALNLATRKVFKIDARFGLIPSAEIRRLKLEDEWLGGDIPASGRQPLALRPEGGCTKKMKTDRKFILELNKPLPISQRPFKSVAKRLGCSAEKVLSVLRDYKKKGLLRRFGTILSHKNIGLKTNALVAWMVPEKKINSVAKVLVAYPQITHCYLRSTYSFWPYNLYSMAHTADKKTCHRLILAIARKTKIKDFKVLFTLKEFKKTKSNLGGLLR